MFRKAAIACLALMTVTLFGGAQRDAKLDLALWQHLPVYFHGRVMPLETYARMASEAISHRTNPEFTLDGIAESDLKSDEYAGVRELFPELKPRRFEASELLLSWLTEPDKWEHVPFLFAGHQDLRDLLGLPSRITAGEHKGGHLKFVSPAQIADSDAFNHHVDDLRQKHQQAREAMGKVELNELDKSVMKLAEAYERFREITATGSKRTLARNRFFGKAVAALQAWGRLDEATKLLRGAGDGKSDLDVSLTELEHSMQSMEDSLRGGDFSVKKLEPIVAKISTTSAALADRLGKSKSAMFGGKAPNWSEEQLKNARTELTRMAADARTFAKQAAAMHVALYDGGEDALRIVPALNAAALDKDRDIADDAQPWLSLQGVLDGSPALLVDYPEPQVKAVRATFAKLAGEYVARGEANRADHVAAALEQFTAAVRNLAMRTDAAREQLPIVNRDEEMLEYTAYPALGATDAEVTYNHAEPFMWSWVISLAAAAAFALSFGMIKKPMFWCGIALALAGLAWTVYGFYLRVLVTHWAPVTGMYETVIYVPTFVSLLGLWFVLQPIVLPGMKLAWRATALPRSWEAAPLTAEHVSVLSPQSWQRLGLALLIPRLALMGLVLQVLAIRPYAAAGRTIINLTPVVDVGSSLPDTQKLTVWLVGLCVLIPTVWYLPRVILSAAGSLLFVPATFRRHRQEQVGAVYARWPFALASTLVATFLYMLAWYAPILEPGFKPLQPVLRDNFWLTIHVLTEVSSYGAGALAWGLGNIALLYYLLGNYRAPAGASATDHEARFSVPGAEAVAVGGRRPPEACATLSAFAYKAMQVAVLLLAAGTILGGLWADVSWGRFWGWDPKEVWALVSLLTYLVILHGRYAGWFGNFGLAAACVFGATSITMSWFGVNFVLGAGLHSYGFGEGGQLEVGVGVALNWLLLGAAAFRYTIETRSTAKTPDSTLASL